MRMLIATWTAELRLRSMYDGILAGKSSQPYIDSGLNEYQINSSFICKMY